MFYLHHFSPYNASRPPLYYCDYTDEIKSCEFRFSVSAVSLRFERCKRWKWHRLGDAVSGFTQRKGPLLCGIHHSPVTLVLFFFNEFHCVQWKDFTGGCGFCILSYHHVIHQHNWLTLLFFIWVSKYYSYTFNDSVSVVERTEREMNCFCQHSTTENVLTILTTSWLHFPAWNVKK